MSSGSEQTFRHGVCPGLILNHIIINLSSQRMLLFNQQEVILNRILSTRITSSGTLMMICFWQRAKTGRDKRSHTLAVLRAIQTAQVRVVDVPHQRWPSLFGSSSHRQPSWRTFPGLMCPPATSGSTRPITQSGSISTILFSRHSSRTPWWHCQQDWVKRH